MEMNPAAKVGMVAVLALILFGLVLNQLSSTTEEKGEAYVVSFQNVGGLQVKAPVFLAGVKIGHVQKLELNKDDLRVRVTMLITRPNVTLYRARTPEDPPDSFYVYTVTGNLLGDKWLDIRTGRIPPDTKALMPTDPPIAGEPPVTLDDLAREGNEVMGEFRVSVKALNELVADEKFQRDIKTTLANFNDISKNLKGASVDARQLVATLNTRVERLTDSVQLVVAHVDETVTSFQGDARVVGADLRNFSGGLRQMVAKNQGNVDTIVLSLRQTSIALNKTISSLEQLAEDKDLREDIKATVANLKKAAQEIDGIATDIRSITADPEVQSDLRDTITNAREASEGAKRVMDKVEGVTEGITGGKLIQGYAESEWNTNNGQQATNLNAYILPDSSFGAKLGVDSLGRENLVNVQGFAGFNEGRYRIRGGIVRSQFGVGVDARLFSKRFEISVDAYNPRKVQVDVYGKVLFPGDFYLMGGYRGPSEFQPGYPIIGGGKRF